MRQAHTLLRRLALVPALMLMIGLLGLSYGDVQAGEWPASSYVIRVDGLACPYCGYGVEKQFAQQEGVEGTRIDLEAGVVVVTVRPGTRFADDALERFVDKAGFTLGGIVHRPKAEQR